MDEYDVIDMGDSQNEDQHNSEAETVSQAGEFGINTPNVSESETTLQPGGVEINTPTVNVEAPVPELEPTETDGEYNSSTTSLDNEDDQELGSCDCRSECKYNTGKTWKYSDYGFSD